LPRPAPAASVAPHQGISGGGDPEEDAVDERLRRFLHQAEHGDLRPQVNPSAAIHGWHGTPEECKAIEQALCDRLFRLSRPIADASKGATPDMRLSDYGQFYYLLEGMRNAGYDGAHELLWIVLDGFDPADGRSYDELYLWCIVELSRSDERAVRLLWPQVLTLDLRHRAVDWRRPKGVALVDQPYRFAELVFYYYVLRTTGRDIYVRQEDGRRVGRMRPWPLLGTHLGRLAPELSAAQLDLARQVLRDMRGPDCRDAAGVLSEERLQKVRDRAADNAGK